MKRLIILKWKKEETEDNEVEEENSGEIETEDEREKDETVRSKVSWVRVNCKV